MKAMSNGTVTLSPRNDNQTKTNVKNSIIRNGVKSRNSTSPLPPKTSPNKDTDTGVNAPNSKQLKKVVTFSATDDFETKVPKRLLLVSNKCKYGALLEKAVKQDVVAILYNYENNSFDSLLALISASLGQDEKVSSVGCVMTCKHSGIFMLNCHDNSAVLSSTSKVTKANGIGLFFKLLFNTFVERNRTKCRLDFFGAAVVNQLEKNLQDIEDITGATISVSKEPLGIGNGVTTVENGDTFGEIYFTPDKIRNWINGTYQTIDLFEKIRMVGKGAYGTAVLYRKRDDNSLVILKEINMSELNSQERQLAMNETKVLKMLNHPNIVCCYDSFEENGVLMIEMEYADDGTLAQFLAKQECPVPEAEILDMFSQIVCGICYMHEQKVLHRDLKTANIFLTKEKVVKIGDFGVSKIMSSHNKGTTNTVLGTPYYISPEICEGKPYNEKSDIWALGCILHEMATGQKTFEGTNLPALVNKIMRGQISPIQGNYSQDFRQLVTDMLHREPEKRPTAQMLELVRIPELMEKFGSEGSERSFSSTGVSHTNRSRDVSSATHRETRSVLYLYDTSLMGISPIEGFPSKIKIRQVSVGVNHFIVVAMEFTVYTWGQGEHGQLGHGTPEYCSKPQAVEALKGKSVTSACAGDSFSVFVSDNGIVMTCGDGRFGCLGHGDYVSAQRPRLIETLLSTDVNLVACGLRHVVALGSNGEVFAWGDGKDGCLGIGGTDITGEPTAVLVEKGVTIRDIRCGPDGTMFITAVGTLLACGNNRHNKLGLNERRGFLTVLTNKLKLEVEFKKTPTPVKAIKAVVDVAMGKDHTAVLTEQNDVHMLGSNKHAQLGTGDNKLRNMPFLLKSLRDYELTTVICGDKYTAMGTADGTVLFWGTRFPQSSASADSPLTPANDQSSENEGKDSNNSFYNKSHNLFVKNTHRRTLSNTSTVSYHSTLSLNNNQESSEAPSRASSCQDVISLAAGDKTANPHTAPYFDIDSDASPTNAAASPTDMRMPITMFFPRPILNIQASPENNSTVSTPDSTAINIDASKGIVDEKHNSSNDTTTVNFNLFLDCLIPCTENFYILVETNAPVSLKSSEGTTQNETVKKGQLKTQISCLNLSVPKRNKLNSASSNEAGDEYTSSETSELESFGTAPTWIREELKKTLEAVVTDNRNKSVSSQQKIKSNEQTKRPTTLSTNSKQRKRTPSPSPFKVDDKSKSVDCSSSNSSTKSVAKQPVNYLSVNNSMNKESNRSRSKSPNRRRSPQTNMNRLRGNRARGRLGNWEQPKPSRSPIRGNMQELRSKLVKLQNEKRETERRLKEAEEKNENMIREMQKKHEKDRLEQECWLQDQIKLLKKQLDDQQREINERDSTRRKLLKQGSKSDSVKNSKICTIQ